MNPHAVLARRRSEREALIARAASFGRDLDPLLGVHAVVVFGSVARGDFNRWSDIDVLVVAEHLPAGLRQRWEALGAAPAGVQPVAWTVEEWHAQLARGNPIAVEAVEAGVWLVGSQERLSRHPGDPTPTLAERPDSP